MRAVAAGREVMPAGRAHYNQLHIDAKTNAFLASTRPRPCRQCRQRFRRLARRAAGAAAGIVGAAHSRRRAASEEHAASEAAAIY